MLGLSDISAWIRYEGTFFVPYIFALFLFVLNAIAIPVPALFGIKIPFVLMVIYYWSMYRPGMLPSWLLFTSGLLMDVLAGLPLGLNAITYLLLGWLVGRKRLFLLSQPFFVVWFFFAVLSFAMIAFQWSIYSLLSFSLMIPMKLLLSWGIGVFLFPAILLLLRLTHRMLPMKQALGK